MVVPFYGAYTVFGKQNFSDKLGVSKPKNRSQWLKQLGDNLRRERIKKNLSQQRLAKLADLNIRSFQRIEAGEVDVLLTTVVRIHRALNCSWEKLLPN